MRQSYWKDLLLLVLAAIAFILVALLAIAVSKGMGGWV